MQLSRDYQQKNPESQAKLIWLLPNESTSLTNTTWLRKYSKRHGGKKMKYFITMDQNIKVAFS